MQWFRNLFSRRSKAIQDVQMRGRQPTQTSDALRREELPIGAHVRLWGSTARSASTSERGTVQKSAPSPQLQRNEEDFPTSMAVGAATGSVAMGYLAGGSVAGAYLGAAMADDRPSRSSDSGPVESCQPSWSAPVVEQANYTEPSYSQDTSDSSCSSEY